MTAQAPEDGRDITMPLNHLTAAQSGEFSGARYDPRTVIETACRYGLPSDTPPPDAAHRTAPTGRNGRNGRTGRKNYYFAWLALCGSQFRRHDQSPA
jgi:hypothetical protein